MILKQKRFFHLAVLAIFLILVSGQCFAIIERGRIPLYAVLENDNRAVKAELNISILPGDGKVWSSVEPLVGTSTQYTARVSVKLAENYFDRVDQYDYHFDIQSSASVVEGPSAGAAMSLLLISMLQGQRLPENVSITGQISEDGRIGGVGGIFLKAQEAHKTGVDLFMVPEGELYQTHRFPDGIKTVNLADYAAENWGLIVVEAGTIDEALEYAFMDLDEIDLNVSPGYHQPFVPETIDLEDRFVPMKELTASYIASAEEEIKAANDALDRMPASGRDMMGTLLQALTNSNRMLEEAELLYEVNYLYSAANNAFVSMVNARVVRSIAENPSVLEPGSSEMSQRKTALRSDLADLEEHLDSFYTYENIEWLVSAKQRVNWAFYSLETLDEKANPIERLQDFEFAQGWYEIAGDFYNIALDAEDKVHAQPDLSDLANDYMAEAENCIALLDEVGVDIERRIASARISFEMGWYDAAMADSASAIGLCNSKAKIEDKDLETLMESIDSGLNEFSEKLEADQESIWPELYAVHADYYLKRAYHFIEAGANTRAMQDAKNAAGLYYFADNVFDATSEIKQALTETESSPFTISLPRIDRPDRPSAETDSTAPETTVFPADEFLPLIGAIIAGLLALLIGLILLHSMYGGRRHEEIKLRKKINILENALAKLDKKLFKGKITPEEYEQHKTVYETRLNEVKEILSKKSKQLIEIDRYRGELRELQFVLDQLRRQHLLGELMEEDYRNAINEYTNRLKYVKKELAVKEEELKKLSVDKKKAERKAEKKPRKKTVKKSNATKSGNKKTNKKASAGKKRKSKKTKKSS